MMQFGTKIKEEVGLEKEEKRGRRKEAAELVLDVLPEAPVWTAKLISLAIGRPERSVRQALLKLYRAEKVELQMNTESEMLAHNKEYLYRVGGSRVVKRLDHDMGVTKRFLEMRVGFPKGYRLERAERTRFYVGGNYLEVDDNRVVLRERDWKVLRLPIEHDTGKMRRRFDEHGRPIQCQWKMEMMKKWWLDHSDENLRYLFLCPDEGRLRYLVSIAEDVGTQGEIDCRALFWFTTWTEWEDKVPDYFWKEVWTVAGQKGLHGILR